MAAFVAPASFFYGFCHVLTSVVETFKTRLLHHDKNLLSPPLNVNMLLMLPERAVSCIRIPSSIIDLPLPHHVAFSPSQ